MPAVGDANADDPGRERADFVLGDRDGHDLRAGIHRARRDAIRGMGYSVAINDPYKGVEIVRRHGRRRRAAQLADRAQSAPLHGRDDARAQRELSRARSRPRALVAAVASYVRAAIGKTT
jgi:N-formylglutamate amidohydrolase